MDGRTTPICSKLDGLTFPKSEMRKYLPPLHFNCRSIIVANLTGDPYELSVMPVTEQQGGTFLKLSAEVEE